MRKKTTIKQGYRAFIAKVMAENEVFDNATMAQKRVIIAKDALEHVGEGLFIPDNLNFGDGVGVHDDADLREEFVVRGEICTACARGGLVFAALMRRNGVKGDFDGQSMIEEFPKEMMEDIEIAFEGPFGCVDTDDLREWEDLTDALEDVGKISSANYRFVRIMHWIIDHHGSFNLERFLEKELPTVREMKANHRNDHGTSDMW